MDIEKLRQDQLSLAKKVILSDMLGSIRRIAGADQAYIDDNTILSVIVIVDIKTQEVLDKKYTMGKCPLQYIPGFLSYREAPTIIETNSKLKEDYDLIIVEGNGILHPRKIGLASYVGIHINKPTIGISKSLLCGEVSGNSVYLDKDVIGKVVKPYEYTKPLFVSPGHLISLKRSYEIVKSLFIKPYKLPYPLAQANKYAKKLKKKFREERISSKT